MISSLLLTCCIVLCTAELLTVDVQSGSIRVNVVGDNDHLHTHNHEQHYHDNEYVTRSPGRAHVIGGGGGGGETTNGPCKSCGKIVDLSKKFCTECRAIHPQVTTFDEDLNTKNQQKTLRRGDENLKAINWINLVTGNLITNFYDLRDGTVLCRLVSIIANVPIKCGAANYPIGNDAALVQVGYANIQTMGAFCKLHLNLDKIIDKNQIVLRERLDENAILDFINELGMIAQIKAPHLPTYGVVSYDTPEVLLKKQQLKQNRDEHERRMKEELRIRTEEMNKLSDEKEDRMNQQFESHLQLIRQERLIRIGAPVAVNQDFYPYVNRVKGANKGLDLELWIKNLQTLIGYKTKEETALNWVEDMINMKVLSSWHDFRNGVVLSNLFRALDSSFTFACRKTQQRQMVLDNWKQIKSKLGPINVALLDLLNLVTIADFVDGAPSAVISFINFLDSVRNRYVNKKF